MKRTHTGPLLPEYSGAGGVACTYILTSSFSVERGQWYCETKTHSWTPGMQRCFVPAANPHRNPPTPCWQRYCLLTSTRSRVTTDLKHTYEHTHAHRVRKSGSLLRAPLKIELSLGHNMIKSRSCCRPAGLVPTSRNIVCLYSKSYFLLCNNFKCCVLT